MRIITTKFDKNVLGNVEYRHSAIKAMSDRSNLSKLLSSLIGYFPDFNPNAVPENKFRGVFERVVHKAYSFKNNEKEKVLKLLKDYLSLDSGTNYNIHSKTFDNYKADLIIDKDNIDTISDKIGECKICKNKIGFQFVNNFIEEEKDRNTLYLPSLIFKNGDRFFKSLFQEIATHRICTHASVIQYYVVKYYYKVIV